MLHAAKLEFVHPTTKKIVKFEAPLPKYFKEVLEKLEFRSQKLEVRDQK